MFKLYLYRLGIHKSTEEHPTHLSAYRSGENWALLRWGNTFEIKEEKFVKRSTENFLWEAHMDELLGGRV